MPRPRRGNAAASAAMHTRPSKLEQRRRFTVDPSGVCVTSRVFYG
jgi:hypothetical protein